MKKLALALLAAAACGGSSKPQPVPVTPPAPEPAPATPPPVAGTPVKQQPEPAAPKPATTDGDKKFLDECRGYIAAAKGERDKLVAVKDKRTIENTPGSQLPARQAWTRRALGTSSRL